MTASESKNTAAGGQGMLATLSSLQFGIILLIAIAVIATIGTVIPQNQPPEFYAEHFGGFVQFLVTVFRFDITYRSPLFIGLLLLFGVNLVLCSLIRFPGLLKRTFAPDTTPSRDAVARMPVHAEVAGHDLADVAGTFADAGFPLKSHGGKNLYGEKGRMGYLGSSLVHLSLLLFLAGGIVSLATSIRGYIILEPGDTVSEAILPGDRTVPLGFTVTLDRFDVEFYGDHPGRPKTYASYVTVEVPGEPSFYTDIRVNHPLLRNGFTVYQSSYGPIEDSAPASPEDRATIALSLAGAPDEMPPITTQTLQAGETAQVPGFGDSLSIQLAEIHRNFSRIQSVGGGANPAVKVDLLVHGEVRWSVYAFQNFPGMNMPMSQDMPLLFTLIEIEAAGGDAAGTSVAGYYTVLGVTRDHGIPFMWTASALMMIGLVCSFYIRPRRIWAVEESGTVYIGAQTKGETGSLEAFVTKILKPLKPEKRHQ